MCDAFGAAHIAAAAAVIGIAGQIDAQIHAFAQRQIAVASRSALAVAAKIRFTQSRAVVVIIAAIVVRIIFAGVRR